jgi:hypothetical protein
MLGYQQPQSPLRPRDNSKKIKLLVENLENIVNILKEELEENTEDECPIDLNRIFNEMQEPYEEPQYVYESEDDD